MKFEYPRAGTWHVDKDVKKLNHWYFQYEENWHKKIFVNDEVSDVGRWVIQD